MLNTPKTILNFKGIAEEIFKKIKELVQNESNYKRSYIVGIPGKYQGKMFYNAKIYSSIKNLELLVLKAKSDLIVQIFSNCQMVLGIAKKNPHLSKHAIKELQDGAGILNEIISSKALFSDDNRNKHTLIRFAKSSLKSLLRFKSELERIEKGTKPQEKSNAQIIDFQKEKEKRRGNKQQKQERKVA